MMVKRMIVLFMVVGLGAGSAIAEEQQAQKESGLGAWLKSMQKRLSFVSPRKPLPVTTGVAGVRGAKEENKAKLYWKGKKGDEPVSEAELTEFKAAVDLAEKGDNAGAIKGIEKFMAQYPDSALIPDAKKTLDLVKAEPPAAAAKPETAQEPAAQPKAEPKAEPKAAPKAEPKKAVK